MNSELNEQFIKKQHQQPGFFSKIFFIYIFPLIKLANKTPLEYEMIQDLHESDQSESLYQRLNATFQLYQDSKNGLYKSILMTFKRQFIIVYIIILVNNVLLMYGPIMINQTLSYIDQPNHTTQESFKWLGIIIGVKILSAITFQNSYYMLTKLGYDQISAVSVYIMKKTLRVSFQSNKKYKTGEIMNIMQVDLQRLLQFNYAMSQAIFVPFQIGITFYLLFMYLGVSFLAGLAIMIICLFANFQLIRQGWKTQKQVMKAKDARTKQAHEIFSNIKFIKANAFEQFFRNKLNIYREKEIKQIKKRNVIRSFQIWAMFMTPQLTLNAALALFIVMQNSLTPADTFSIISLFSILQQSASMLPNCLNQIIEANISIKRIQQYLQTDEVMDQCIRYTTDILSDSLIFKNGTFYWDKLNNNDNNDNNQQEIEKKHKSNQVFSEVITQENSPIEKEVQPILKNLNLKIDIGEFITIIGDVGSGKSSLINAIFGEMLYNQQQIIPSIQVNGTIAYVSQKSWIQNATVKENILFGKPFNEKKYSEVLKYSCMEQDLKIFDKGDSTMIGEKGVNLSGGQKARISLARALYSDRDIYLLDDLISAVDMHVGKFIIEQCLGFYLNGKTIILVTHALYACQYSDRIILMDNGQIIQEGNLEEIKKGDKFQQVYQKFFQQEQQEQQEVEEENENITKLVLEKKKKSQTEQQLQFKDIVDDLMLLEDRKKGSVSSEIYMKYFKMNGGWWLFLFNVIIVTCQVVTRFGSQIWLAKWSGAGELTYEENLHYLIIFSLISLSIGFFALIRTLNLSSEGVNTADKIHTKVINALLYAPLCQFFERIPLGVLMNRLTKDQSVLDMDIVWTISILYISTSNFIASTAINVYSSSLWILIPIVIFVACVWSLQRFYMAANRELYRLESMSKSPILSYFSETINGLQIIRAYQKADQFLLKHIKNIDLNRKMQITSLQTNIWFSMNLTFLSFIVNVSAIGYVLFFGNDNPALAGLLFTVATVIDNSLQSFINQVAQAETQFISFERCQAFIKIDHEPGYLIQKEYITNWPSVGDIAINDLQVKYRENLSPALKGLNVVIKSQEKIGVVGRTGAGKSTVTLSLLRILEAWQGNIIIDGIDISTLSLKQLRENITMILQDSVLFEGTLRENLDPLKQHKDQELIDVCLQCCLGEILQQRNSLETEITENGDNLSAGEKQLITIARAVLKQSQIVLIDEATANIDVDTESKIQQTIKTAFKKCTVITIAHRINTIMHCDKILVIDEGQAKEFDDPQILLSDKQSLFYNLYQQGKKSNKL